MKRPFIILSLLIVILLVGLFLYKSSGEDDVYLEENKCKSKHEFTIVLPEQEVNNKSEVQVTDSQVSSKLSSQLLEPENDKSNQGVHQYNLITQETETQHHDTPNFMNKENHRLNTLVN